MVASASPWFFSQQLHWSFLQFQHTGLPSVHLLLAMNVCRGSPWPLIPNLTSSSPIMLLHPQECHLWFRTLGSQGRGNAIEFGVKAHDQCICQIRIFNIHSNSTHLVPDCLQSLNVIMDQHILIMFDTSHWLRDPKWWKK